MSDKLVERFYESKRMELKVEENTYKLVLYNEVMSYYYQ